MLLVKSQELILVRDTLWRGIVAARAEASRRIVSEKIETAYVGLYGYHPQIQKLYDVTIVNLRRIDDEAYESFLLTTQQVVMSLDVAEGQFISAQLGNRLRAICCDTSSKLRKQIESVIAPLQEQLLRLMESRDFEIATKRSQVLSGLSGNENMSETPTNNILNSQLRTCEIRSSA